MNKNIFNNTSLITKIAGGVFSILGLSLLGIDYLHNKKDIIELDENDISVEDEPIAKNTTD